MIVVVVSRILQWLHLQPQHSLSWPSPPSPRSSTEKLVLPLSASSQKTSFTDVPSEESRTHHFPSVHAPIVFVICLLPISTALVFYCTSTLPITLAWPRTLEDVAQLGRELTAYTQSGTWPLLHVMGVMAITAIWKHAWSIPGSVIWNVLAGALFSPIIATLFLTTLTTIGSICATLLATPLAPFLTYLFPRALDMTRTALHGESDNPQDDSTTEVHKSKSSAWVRLSVLRLVGVVPWSGINIACGVCGVSLGDCVMGAFIGCLPWTAVTCQIGDILQTVVSTSSNSTPESISSILMSPRIIIKLALLSFLSLAPILARNRLRKMIHPSVFQSSPENEQSSRRNWVRDLRTKISKTRSRDRKPSLKLNILVQEKRAIEELPS
ncbi:hypothetical protein AGABI1DRAFT_113326 [Agaricus bisporus var. burnettii JB137-S8]|uniref:VTT domain-containing protein n=1 Tax=Agaricus bisporus var. burnettii (strain JB137-S8 / ATCC MYA-4627 / FGSC 10392) TaxID=597362 RepID=K5W026_AGABU|nr:uncharacterized protein AGABI1DRAFT_113326 [Agaricus bisporus var. burnettii JB137-S8]EKM80104.1 hypothetical protein AGABI1DRAFT_113326 [Agaricus bisporus var. burnettii JB137-S8]